MALRHPPSMSTVTNSMENTPPVRIVSKYNSDSDRLHWNLLPTLSQPTRHTIDSNKNIKTSKSPSRKNNTLMDSTRENTQVGGEDSKWKDRSSLLTPPNSQDATSMLISPPPEEILRIEFNSRHSAHHRQVSASRTQTIFSPNLPSSTIPTDSASAFNSKRKRPGVVTLISASNPAPTPSLPIDTATMFMNDDEPPEATPNPKPRKQSKRHAYTQSLDSPTRTVSSHLSVSASARRSRGTTPIPPYEPPKEIFTPPREVTISPPHPFRNRRKSQASYRVDVGKPEVGRVKKELPDIDWTTPMPPPSPGDDPLLLSGRPRVERIRADSRSSSKGLTSAFEEHEDDADTIQLGENGLELDNSGPMDPSMGLESPSTDFSDAATLPVFDMDPAQESNNYGDGWSDSDDDEELAGEGEYTGKFMMVTVKTKADPPTSGTKSRMDQWGRPISPFPGTLGRKCQGLPPSVGEAGDEMDELPVLADNEGEDEDFRVDANDDNVSDAPLEADNASSSNDETDRVKEGVVTITSNDPLVAARAAAILKLHDYDHIPKIPLKTLRSSNATRRKSAIESGVTKSSNSTGKRRYSTLGGVIGDLVYIPGSPVMTLPELLKQAEVGLDERATAIHQTPFKPLNLSGDPFTTPGLRCTSIPEHERGQDIRQWTKQDWKQLDACFTDERLHVAESLGMPEDALADVDDIKIEGVVERFIQTIGGAEEVKIWGPLWDRDNLATRVRALQKKQRSGNVAPPTPGGRSPAPRPSANNHKSGQPGLPLPPPEVLEKPRRPIVTPIRPPAAKVVPQKTQVHLQHAPSPKKSVIPRPSKPQRLVKLNPTPMPPPPIPVQRNRRSSGGSVKDLVRDFEVLDQAVKKFKPEIRQIKNSGSERRPTWKP